MIMFSLLTPSNRNTVDERQSLYCLVKTLANRVMNNIITSVSVLHVVSANHTCPSDDIAAMILIFYDNTLSGLELIMPRLFHRFCRKSTSEIQLSSTLMIRSYDWYTLSICCAYIFRSTLHRSELPANGTCLIFLYENRYYSLSILRTI